MGIIAEAPTPTRIVFSTDGSRARIAEDYLPEATIAAGEQLMRGG